MMKRVTKEDQVAFDQMTKKRPISFSLVYKQGKKEENIPGMIEKSYTLCQWKRGQIEKEPQYKSGELIIKPNY